MRRLWSVLTHQNLLEAVAFLSLFISKVIINRKHLIEMEKITEVVDSICQSTPINMDNKTMKDLLVRFISVHSSYFDSF